MSVIAISSDEFFFLFLKFTGYKATNQESSVSKILKTNLFREYSLLEILVSYSPVLRAKSEMRLSRKKLRLSRKTSVRRLSGKCD